MALIKVHSTDSFCPSILISNPSHHLLRRRTGWRRGVWKMAMWHLSDVKLELFFIDISIRVMLLLNTINPLAFSSRCGFLFNWNWQYLEIKIFPNGDWANALSWIVEFISGSHNVTLFQTKKNQAKRWLSRAQSRTDCQSKRLWYYKNGRGQDAAPRCKKWTLDRPTPTTIVLPHKTSKAGALWHRTHSIESGRSWCLWEKTNSGIWLFIIIRLFIWPFKGTEWFLDAILRLWEVLFRPPTQSRKSPIQPLVQYLQQFRSQVSMFGLLRATLVVPGLPLKVS